MRLRLNHFLGKSKTQAPPQSGGAVCLLAPNLIFRGKSVADPGGCRIEKSVANQWQFSQIATDFQKKGKKRAICKALIYNVFPLTRGTDFSRESAFGT